MMGLRTIWKDSINELKDVRVLSCCGILAALSIALKHVASIDIGEYVRIGFSGLPGMVVSVFFGPAVGGIFFGMLDIIKYLIAPSGFFFPGFTLSAALQGVLIGFIAYHREVQISRFFIAQLLIKVFLNVGLNTLWLCILYNTHVFAILPTRILLNTVMLPIDTALMFIVVRFTSRVWYRVMERSI